MIKPSRRLRGKQQPCDNRFSDKEVGRLEVANDGTKEVGGVYAGSALCSGRKNKGKKTGSEQCRSDI